MINLQRKMLEILQNIFPRCHAHSECEGLNLHATAPSALFFVFSPINLAPSLSYLQNKYLSPFLLVLTQTTLLHIWL